VLVLSPIGDNLAAKVPTSPHFETVSQPWLTNGPSTMVDICVSFTFYSDSLVARLKGAADVSETIGEGLGADDGGMCAPAQDPALGFLNIV